MLINKYISEKDYFKFSELDNDKFDIMVKKREKNTIINGYSQEKNKFFHILKNGEKEKKVLEIFDFDKSCAELYDRKGNKIISFEPEEGTGNSKEEKEEEVCFKITTFLQNLFF